MANSPQLKDILALKNAVGFSYASPMLRLSFSYATPILRLCYAYATPMLCGGTCN